MPDTAPAFTVSHNAARDRFETTLNGHTSVAEYQMLDGAVMRLTHTSVHPSLEGRGIAGALAKAAMAHARTEKLKIDPQCPYMRSYMERHPETHDLRA
jgi:predicted GNAT family acetyltransferase